MNDTLNSRNTKLVDHQLSRTSALCIGDVGRAEGPGSEGETSSVVGKGMGVFELDFEWPVPFSFIF